MSDTIEANSGIASYVLHWVYRPAVISRVRSAFVERYPDTWQAELASTLGDRWREAADSATSRELSKIYDVSADDEFDYLDVAHFPLLFKRHFDTLFPEVNLLSEEGYRRVRASLLLSVNEAKEARNALSHPTAAGFSVDDVLSLLVFVRRVLKHVAPESVREVALTMRQVIDADVPAVEKDALNTYLHGKPAARSPRRCCATSSTRSKSTR